MQRPEPSAALDPEEFSRWYWLKVELQEFARLLGIPAGGAKRELEERIAAALSGERLQPVERPPSVDGLPEVLDAHTILPPGQRLTTRLRDYLTQQCGPGFRFDAHMRGLIKDGDVTLAEAVQHWHDTRGMPVPEPAEQFEYNRFVRSWRKSNPGGTHRDLVAAWWEHRGQPR